jgi:nucleotide-binding universal stress UspA family protein
MRPFKHILCPVDFSDFSRRAVKVARGLAGDFEAQLHLFHVLDIRAFSPAEAALAPKIDAANRRRVEDQMARLAESEGLSPGQVEIAEGLPHKAIVQKAEELPVDLVVMGTHGISGFERLLLGSVTEKVLHQVQVPLLAVSQKVPDSALAAEEKRRFQTVLVATDLGADAVETVEYALSLGMKYNSRTLILHVVPPPMAFFGPMEAPWMGSVEIEDVSDRLKKDSHKRLEELIPERLRETCEPEFLVREGAPSATILDLARERDVDLIVVGAHGHGKSDLGWVGSTCHRVMRAAKCPVLAVRPRT